MLGWIIERLKALKFWAHDMVGFWAPLEHQSYTVECPNGHQTTMAREQVLQLSFADSQVAMIDWGFADHMIVRIRYVECPHPECVAETKRHSAILA